MAKGKKKNGQHQVNGQGPATPVTDGGALTNIDPDVKSLDLAWEKVTKGSELWIEGTLELINILDFARKRHASDQAFGAWLDEAGYRDKISRDDRQALLNMARLDDVRAVLENTHRRSWQLIWREDVQGRLRSATQPAPGEQAAGAEKATEAPVKPAAKGGAQTGVFRRQQRVVQRTSQQCQRRYPQVEYRHGELHPRTA